jgi:acyl carrier protein
MSETTVIETIRQYLTEHLCHGDRSKLPADDASLIASRLMDSIITLKLVSYLEDTFGIAFEAHEVTQDNLDSINKITAFVHRKQST